MFERYVPSRGLTRAEVNASKWRLSAVRAAALNQKIVPKDKETERVFNENGFNNPSFVHAGEDTPGQWDEQYLHTAPFNAFYRVPFGPTDHFYLSSFANVPRALLELILGHLLRPPNCFLLVILSFPCLRADAT